MIGPVNPSRGRVVAALCGLALCAILVVVYAFSITLSSSASSYGMVLVLVWILAMIALYFLGRGARYWTALRRQGDPEGR